MGARFFPSGPTYIKLIQSVHKMIFSYTVNWKYIERHWRYTDILRWVIAGQGELSNSIKRYLIHYETFLYKRVQCNTDISFITWALELYLCISFIVTCFFRRFALRVSLKKQNNF